MDYEIDAFRDKAREHLAIQIEAVRGVFRRFGELVSARERLLGPARAAY
jgi:hypothetical protein